MLGVTRSAHERIAGFAPSHKSQGASQVGRISRNVSARNVDNRSSVRWGRTGRRVIPDDSPGIRDSARRKLKSVLPLRLRLRQRPNQSRPNCVRNCRRRSSGPGAGSRSPSRPRPRALASRCTSLRRGLRHAVPDLFAALRAEPKVNVDYGAALALQRVLLLPQHCDVCDARYGYLVGRPGDLNHRQ